MEGLEIETIYDQEKQEQIEIKQFRKLIFVEFFSAMLFVIDWLMFWIFYEYLKDCTNYQRWLPAFFSLGAMILFSLVQYSRENASFPVKIIAKNKIFQIYFMSMYLAYLKFCFNLSFFIMVLLARNDYRNITTYSIVLGCSTLVGSICYSIQARRYRYGPPFKIYMNLLQQSEDLVQKVKIQNKKLDQSETKFNKNANQLNKSSNSEAIKITQASYIGDTQQNFLPTNAQDLSR
ncbi:hypothetical protein PPERSA_01840 [Pseudocohnilembus persalinus]|uniref:Transmembrane protein n=1 Tax=Pseudocohnilembus persalinus TaxID=266149 RepID=A0A0V0QKB6_PSEPJ|nr:hypothetical protein PPERSA_01840 [Pseudocohnilembus persalinus]|eukprot:KRX02723.1 hypothetical protein PPERSA_01840 [Pseudocohnilembus persalinus]